jgi:dipeptidyl aminopeptidase/acylaminoacyl peptidase
VRRFLIVVAAIVVLLVLIAQAQASSRATNAPPPVAQKSVQTSANQSLPKLPTVNDWKAKTYPGSAISVEQTVDETDAYTQYVTSYYSDGLRISALLTVPKGDKPKNGWPVFVWNHGGADPATYGRQNDDSVGKLLASRGFVVFQPAYRGYAGSDGDPMENAGPAVDSLNAIASIKRYPDVNASRLGVGGHSMGGSVTLFDVVISQDIKAAVTVAGTFVSFRENVEQGMQLAAAGKLSDAEKERWKPIDDLIKANGSPSENPDFWAQFDFLANLSSITAPMQIHHGLKDDVVPWQQSQHLYDELRRLNKPAELYLYPDGDHQLSTDAEVLLNRVVEFLDRYLKAT